MSKGWKVVWVRSRQAQSQVWLCMGLNTRQAATKKCHCRRRGFIIWSRLIHIYENPGPPPPTPPTPKKTKKKKNYKNQNPQIGFCNKVVIQFQNNWMNEMTIDLKTITYEHVIQAYIQVYMEHCLLIAVPILDHFIHQINVDGAIHFWRFLGLENFQ